MLAASVLQTASAGFLARALEAEIDALKPPRKNNHTDYSQALHLQVRERPAPVH